MRPLTTTVEWPMLGAYDLEADEWINITLVCHVDETGERRHFVNTPDKPAVSQYIDWLFSCYTGEYLFAHAGGHYDHRFLMAECHSRGWSFSTNLSGGSIVLLKINNGKRTIKFVDSYRLLPDGLAKIGKTVKLPKIDLDPSQLANVPFSETLEYCYRDCDIVLKGLQLMKQTTTGAGADFAITLASMAARYNRRNSAIDWDCFVERKGKKLVPHHNIKDWDRACHDGGTIHKVNGKSVTIAGPYFGGRSDMLVRGIHRGEFYLFDIVSSYPTSMLEPLPLYYLGFFTLPRNSHDIDKFIAHCGVTICTVRIPPMHIGVLPVKDASGRIIFPADDTITGSWTNIELQEAVKQGCEITEIVGQYRFKAEPFLRKFVLKFYQLRQNAKNEKDEFSSYAFKILLNSSYGKLVETIQRVSYCTAGELPRIIRSLREQGLSASEIEKRIETTNTVGVFCTTTEEVGPFRHTAAGAYVTALSRLRLYRMAKEMHDKGATIMYCDTDSLILDMKIEKTGNALGDWQHVATLSEVELVLPKVYRAVPTWHESGNTKTIYKCKGCPIERRFEPEGKAEERWHAFLRANDTPEDIALLGKPGVTGFKSDVKAGTLHPRKTQAACRPCKSSGYIKGVVCSECHGDGYIVRPLSRALRSEDKKRIWSGQTSRPISFSKDNRK